SPDLRCQFRHIFGELTHNIFARAPPQQSINTLVDLRLYHRHFKKISQAKAGTASKSLLK
ncbi:hypothetical protein, partial [Klebsiella pneumoniae]|uniref:hypothetical protein n=1 Tax=Klebsiella pneumoniae TaxID=573 RepID=UPI0030136DE0